MVMEKDDILRQVGGNPVSLAIVASELDRIEAFAVSDFMPDQEWTKADLAELGFTLDSGHTEWDIHAKFIKATFPAGWRKQLNKDRDWRIDLFDAKNQWRGEINYKPSDHARLTLFTRFLIEFEYGTDNHTMVLVISDRLTSEVLMRSEILDEDDFSQSRDKAWQRLSDYLDNQFPGWKSVTAYWD